MKSVALYDLANKIFSVFSLLFSNINAALYPKIAINPNPIFIKKIIVLEFFIGGSVIFFIVVSGKILMNFITNKDFLDVYYLIITLSVNVITYLIVGAITYFVFVLQEKQIFILKNQILSAGSFLFFCVLNTRISFSIHSITLALVLSGFIEMLYCFLLAKKIGFNLAKNSK